MPLIIKPMKDENKTKEQLLRELEGFRRQAADLESAAPSKSTIDDALREIEARYRALFDRSLFCVYVHDMEGNFLDANDAALNLLGYKKEEIPLVSFSTLLDEGQMHRAFKILEDIKLTGSQKAPAEFKVRKRDGGYVWIETEASVIYRKGRPYAIQGIARDISERKKAERSLKESEEKFRLAFENAKDAIFWADAETGEIINCNKSAEFLLGREGEDIIGHNQTILHPPQKADYYIKMFKKHITQKGAIDEEAEVITKSGEIVPVHITASLTFVGGKPVIQGLFRDITERKKTEEALQNSEIIYRTAIDFTYDWEYWLGPDRNYVYVSPSCKRITGYGPDEFLSDPDLITKITHPEDRSLVTRHFHEGLQNMNDLSNMDFRIISRSGEERWISHYCMPVYNEKGVWLGRRGSNRDITEQKRAKEELMRSNAELKQFAHAVSHDLREPLYVVDGFAKLLQRRYGGKIDATADEFIGFIIDGVKRMQTLIKDILEYSEVRLKDTAFESTDTSLVVGFAIGNLKASIRENDALITYDEALPTVMGNFSQLCRLFQNLIGNAIKFRGENPPEVHIAAEKRGNEVVFSVRDNGIGIDLRNREQIFNVFQRLHSKETYPGTGIGLAICKRIVENHGGRIWVDSEPGKGSTFYFSIPLQH